MDPLLNKNLKNWLASYRKAVDINIITSITNQKGNIIYVNKKFCQISEYSKTELIGKQHNIINSGFHSKEFFDDLWSTLKKGKIWNGEIRNKTKSGKFYWVDTVIIPVKVGNETQYLSLRTLITNKKVLEEKREEYIKSMENLLFMVSHKIRSPVCTIIGLLQLLDNKNLSINSPEIAWQLKKPIQELDEVTKELSNDLHLLTKKIK
ncbi:MAG: PAS domain-containing protein [Bacteroidota bacterium]|nr:PAS domain-containing protein [Bacteroidota bacterium]